MIWVITNDIRYIKTKPFKALPIPTPDDTARSVGDFTQGMLAVNLKHNKQMRIKTIPADGIVCLIEGGQEAAYSPREIYGIRQTGRNQYQRGVKLNVFS